MKIGALLVLVPSMALAGVLDDLSANDREKVTTGAQVMVTEELDGYPWPRARVYQAVDATPEEVMAIFFDYDAAKNFVPNCRKSAISEKIDARTYQVDYCIDVPIFPDEEYTVRNDLSKDGETLKVSWKVIKASSIQESFGDLLVEPLGSGSVVRYTNLVKPSSKAAVLLKGMAMGQMKDTVQALLDEVVAGKRGGTIDEQMQRLKTALGD